MIRHKLTTAILGTLLLVWGGDALARPNVGQPIRQQGGGVKRLAAGCSPATAAVDLDINNVRARILNGGDMWWDLVGTARYEVPKVPTPKAGETPPPRKNALFAGALWIGGYERNNLKLAAMTYRQTGSDFFPGPLDSNANIDGAECTRYDRIWKINKSDVDKFRRGTGSTDAIQTWPGNPIDLNKGQRKNLAPYVDVNANGIYDPLPNGGAGSDYPDIKGDQALWFVYNDKGNIHSETQAQPIGLEVRTMAFGFISNDQISNMTFYANQIVYHGTTTLDSTFFGQWVDPDLGNYADDYVGCDTLLDLGYCYNGDDNDDGLLGYGLNPPAVGVDFFEGPAADPNNGRDDDRDGTIDEPNEKIGMAKFVYYDNDRSNYGNPEQPSHYYNYLTGTWKNGNPITNDNKNGRSTGFPRGDFMFPGDPATSRGWTEGTVLPKNPPADRRFLQSAGPFKLKPGAVNNVTVGVVWARSSTGGATGGLNELRFADRLAQTLYNSGFKSILGPEPPVVDVTELDRKIVLSFVNESGSIDTTERFDKFIPSDIPGRFRHFKFEGYQIFQLQNSSITSGELDDPNKARLVAQVDVKNDITQIVNDEFDAILGSVKKLKVTGQNRGIRHTFELTGDAFAAGEDQLVNNQFYYYMVLAYASNPDVDERQKYLAGKPATLNEAQVIRAVPHKSAPHKGGNDLPADYGDQPEITRLEGQGNGGFVLDLTQESLDQLWGNPRQTVISNPKYQIGRGPVGVTVFDPLRVKPYDFELRITDTATKTPATRDGVRLTANRTKWTLYNRTAGYTGDDLQWNSEDFLHNSREQVIPSLGLTVNVTQPEGPGSPNDSVRETHGFLEATLTYVDSRQAWLRGIPDAEQPGTDAFKQGLPLPQNWIRSGTGVFSSAPGSNPVVTDDFKASKDPAKGLPDIPVDPRQAYEDILGGTIAPAALAARTNDITQNNGTVGKVMTLGPMPNSYTGFTSGPNGIQTIANINSVDIVFTPDRSKWTKCLVLEMQEVSDFAEGNVKKFRPRAHGNPFILGADGLPVYKPGENTTEDGFSWFPGYAINIETGERLNIIFGEDSYLKTENGADMLFNPTNNNWQYGYQNPSQLTDPNQYVDRYLWGGKHWMYVMNSSIPQLIVDRNKDCMRDLAKEGGVRYDSCKTYNKVLRANPCSNIPGEDLRAIFNSAMWVSLPVLAPPPAKLKSVDEGLIPTEAKIRIRVAKPYATLRTSNTPENNFMPRYTFGTGNLAPKESQEAGKKALELVNVVPNPYYAFSGYEAGQLDNRVRITNLPAKAKITIMTIDGAVVRRLTLDQSVNEANPRHTTFLDWDLKNEARVPIASGVYLIHVDAGELGTKVLKWFGVMRPIDLDTF